MELSSRQIEEKRFTKAMRGYDKAEVDDFVARCASHTSALEERTKIAEVRASNAEEELAGLKAEIDVLLQEAKDARNKIIEEAKAEATTIASQVSAAGGSSELAGSAAKAAAIITEAETAAKLRLDGVEHIKAAAQDEAAGIVKRAEQSAALTRAEADRLLDKARLDASSIREESQATRASLEAQLAEIRRLLDATRSGDLPIEDLADAPMVGGSDSELVIDLREEAEKPESHHAAG